MLTDHAPSQPPPSGASTRWVGGLDRSLLAGQATRGRRRSWLYAAAGDATGIVGAAVVDVGLLGLGTVFAFASHGGRTMTWEPGPGRVGRVEGLGGTALVQRRGAMVRIDEHHLVMDVPVTGGRLTADIELGPVTPVSLVTPTPRGGWNATTKAAGHTARGRVATPAGAWALDGGAWTDGTEGRQDRHTTWRWAAGAGTSHAGARVGIQASTGMNGVGHGEDIVWWDDQPHPLEVHTLAPVDEHAGAWRLGGPGWELRLDPSGVRAADEGIGPLRSTYTQPIGTWTGTLPSPEGAPVEVVLHGVAEDHDARW